LISWNISRVEICGDFTNAAHDENIGLAKLVRNISSAPINSYQLQPLSTPISSPAGKIIVGSKC
jgi:hypothetical protein